MMPHAAPRVTAVPLTIALGAGPDREVQKLFDGPRRRLVQITLRNGSVLARHQAAVPITVQCLAGTGEFQADDGPAIALTPGVLLTLEPDVPHSAKGTPAVSFLLTQFPQG